MGTITARTAIVAAAASMLLVWPAAASGATPVGKDFYGEGPNKTIGRQGSVKRDRGGLHGWAIRGSWQR